MFITSHMVIAQQQKFRVTPHDLQVLEGSEALLGCEVTNLAGQVQWTKDGFALGKSSHFELDRRVCNWLVMLANVRCLVYWHLPRERQSHSHRVRYELGKQSFICGFCSTCNDRTRSHDTFATISLHARVIVCCNVASESNSPVDSLPFCVR